MNTSRIVGHAAGAAAGSAVWLISVNLPKGNPGPELQAAGALPWAVVLMSLLLQWDADRRMDREAAPREQRTPAITPRRPAPQVPQEVA